MLYALITADNLSRVYYNRLYIVILFASYYLNYYLRSRYISGDSRFLFKRKSGSSSILRDSASSYTSYNDYLIRLKARTSTLYIDINSALSRVPKRAWRATILG
jgi:hypothetical protein